MLTTNCSNNYGPYQFPEKLIPLMILNALEGKPLPVYGDGQQVRDWLYVEDHCRAIRTVLARGTPGEVYNIGGDCERTEPRRRSDRSARLVDRLRPGLPHAPARRLITLRRRPARATTAATPSTPARSAPSWAGSRARTSRPGIERTVRWYLDNPDWVDGVIASGSIGERSRWDLAGRQTARTSERGPAA